jgi:hypothetical protein
MVLFGTELAHALAYRIAYPQLDVRVRVLAETGHGYLGLAPEALGLGCALVLLGLISDALASVRRLPSHSLPPWAFGLLPATAFSVQEFVERWVATSGVPWWMVLQPTFRIGLLLQLPFGLASYLVARLLLRVARRAALAMRRAGPAGVVRGERRRWSVRSVLPLRISVPGAGHAGRAPPALLHPLFLSR